MTIKNQILKSLKRSLFVFLSLLLLSGCSSIKNWFSFLSDSNSIKTAEQLGEKDFKKFMAGVKTVKADANNQYKLARHFQKLNRHETAVEEFLKVLKIDPAYYNAYNALGVSYDFLKHHDTAINAYKEALKINPNLDYVHNNIGYSNLLKGDLTAATLAFEKAIAINGDNKTYRNNLALAKAKSTNTDTMIAGLKSPEKQVLHPIIQNDQVTKKQIAEIIDKVVDKDFEPNVDESKVEMVQSAIAREEYFAVQIGVYYDINKAVKTMRDAKRKGYSCPYITKIERDRPYYRVRIGKYQTRPDAKAVASKILDRVGQPSLTIVENYPLKVFHAEIEKKCSDVKIQHTVLNEKLKIEVLNGNGINRMAARVSNYFEKKGFSVATPLNAKHFNFKVTRIYYSPGSYQNAQQLAQKIPGFENAGEFIKSTNLKTDIRILLGKDITPFNKELKRSLKI